MNAAKHQVVCFGEALIDMLALPQASRTRPAPSRNTPAVRRPMSPLRWRAWVALRISSACSGATCSVISYYRACSSPAW